MTQPDSKAQLNSENKACNMCLSLRPLDLHLIELSVFCDLLNNELPIYVISKNNLNQVGYAHTSVVANWLRLAAQLDFVEINTFKFTGPEYCRPVADYLDVMASYRKSIFTHLTRLQFVFNALEESYRLSSWQYNDLFTRLDVTSRKKHTFYNFSGQSSFVLKSRTDKFPTPQNIIHYLNNLAIYARQYSQSYQIIDDVNFDEEVNINWGLNLIRSIRNNILHGKFPITEHPDYDFNSGLDSKFFSSFLRLTTRVTLLYIQILVFISSKDFDSTMFFYHASDEEYGAYFKSNCNKQYLTDIHIENKFELNREKVF